jgi:hypothetical protein
VWKMFTGQQVWLTNEMIGGCYRLVDLKGNNWWPFYVMGLSAMQNCPGGGGGGGAKTTSVGLVGPEYLCSVLSLELCKRSIVTSTLLQRILL